MDLDLRHRDVVLQLLETQTARVFVQNNRVDLEPFERERQARDLALERLGL
jgi:hypothetical protein